MEALHVYRVKAVSTIPRSGVVAAEGIQPSINFSAPPEFQGVMGLWTPEHFLVAGVASCYVSTFSGISEISHFPYASLELETEGVLEKLDGALQFTKIILRPVLKIANEEMRERALRILEKAEKGCLVARSLKCPVELQPEIVVAQDISGQEEKLVEVGMKVQADSI
jgi:organic hydroperoxide reductase OsmC/OhrA